MEHRLEKRTPCCIDLMYGSNDTFCPGSALNVSAHGMLIHAESQMVPIDREIRLVLVLGSDVIGMRGIVCWNSEILELEPEANKHLGVYIPDPHPEYVEYISRLA